MAHFRMRKIFLTYSAKFDEDHVKTKTNYMISFNSIIRDLYWIICRELLRKIRNGFLMS